MLEVVAVALITPLLFLRAAQEAAVRVQKAQLAQLVQWLAL
jgi:hypothetical protein